MGKHRAMVGEAPGSIRLDRRCSGVLLHLTCLPGRFGCGDLGPEAYRFAEWLAAAGQRYWQMLPIGPVGDGPEFSPYNSPSAFASAEILISPERLVADGWLSRGRLRKVGSLPEGRVDYEGALGLRLGLVEEIWAEAGGQRLPEFAAFCAREQGWLEAWSVFRACQRVYPGVPWTRWPVRLKAGPAGLKTWGRSAGGEVERVLRLAEQVRFEQFLFEQQWQGLRSHCAGVGVGLIGDMPIYVGGNSADVWQHRELFELKRDGSPRLVSGCQPDDFNAMGQLWGHPIYRWEAHRASGYGWWLARFGRTAGQFDAVRVDHFIGFTRGWAVAAGAADARRGRFVAAPGMELLTGVRGSFGGLDIIAEDLGLLTEEAAGLRDHFGLPGMRVLQFAFGELNSYHAPHNTPENSVMYTGTHDNETSLGWYRGADRAARGRFGVYAGGLSDPAWRMVCLCLQCPARLAVVPLQDVLGLGNEARVNVPGVLEGNWRWRVRPGMIPGKLAGRLAEVSRLFGRC